MTTPLISIITPAYNAGNYISETISSVINQTFVNWEMIIVDDGSTDHTRSEVEKHLFDKRIRYFYQENSKQAKARNKAISYALGSYLAFIDADDLWEKDKLQKQVDLFTSNNKIDVIYSGGVTFKDTFVELGLNKFSDINVHTGFFEGVDILKILLKRNRIPILSVMVCKQKVNQVGNFCEDPRIQNAEDYQLWLKLADSGCVFFGMTEKLFHYRIHSSQSTNMDSMATKQVIWALHETKLKLITEQDKKQAMLRILNRNILFLIDTASNKFLSDLISLYKFPIGDVLAYIKIKMMLFAGKAKFKKLGYKYFDLN